MEPILLTERLVLAPHDESDVDFMVALNADPDVGKFIGEAPLDAQRARQLVHVLQRQLEERQMARLVVLDRSTGQRLGWCGLKWMESLGAADLGYRFFKNQWGKGYATEASRACLRHGFEDLGLPRIVAEAHRDNARSLRVLEKLGFKRCGQNGETARFEIVRPRASTAAAHHGGSAR
jgi:RimJ/RimL family protein N-acetyltransferase